LDPSTWQGWLESIVLWAAQNPWQFLYYVLLGLSPFFFVSMILSWKLSKAIEAKEKEKKRKAIRDSNIAKSQKKKKSD